MIELRQSTVGQEVPLGYFLDSGDGDTAEPGLSIANTDIKLWKWGATTLADKNSGGATHISGAVYYCVLDDTDTNTLGPMVIFVHVAGALTVRLECAVLTPNVWDSKYSTDKLEVDLTHIHDTALTETSGRLAGRFTDFFNQASATFNVSTVLSSFMANVSDLATTVDLLDKLGAVDEAAAAGDPSATESVMQYVKQIVNVLVGAAGVGTFPAEAAPGNAVSLAEVIRAIHADVTGLNGSAMVGTTPAAVKTEIEQAGSTLALIKAVTDVLPDSGALTTIAADAARLTAVRAAVLTDWINDGRLDVILDAIKTVTEALTSAAATKLALSTGTIVTGTASANSLTTTTMGTDLTGVENDHYWGRIIIWTSGTLQNQATDITDYAATDGVLTFTAVTAAPSEGDTFIIV